MAFVVTIRRFVENVILCLLFRYLYRMGGWYIILCIDFININFDYDVRSLLAIWFCKILPTGKELKNTIFKMIGELGTNFLFIKDIWCCSPGLKNNWDYSFTCFTICWNNVVKKSIRRRINEVKKSSLFDRHFQMHFPVIL